VFVASVRGSQFDGNYDDRTPKSLQTVTAAYVFPGRGRVYVLYRYIGAQYVDIANQLQLPGYSLLGAGFTFDINAQAESERLR